MGIHVFLWRSHRSTNRVFRLVYPVYAMNTRFMYSQNRLTMNRIPYCVLRSAYSTCRYITDKKMSVYVEDD